MGKAAKEQLNRALSEHLNTIHETLQMLDQTPASSLDKVSWQEVIKMGEQVSKQATMVGMLYAGETPEVKVLEENMSAYFNMLQGFLLLSHGSSVGAGPTLFTYIQASIKQVVDSSFVLMKEAVSSYGSHDKGKKLSITQLVGTVWDGCSALKKTPSTNTTAIGRSLTQVTVSINDVLREMKDLKPASADLPDEAANGIEEENPSDGDNSFDGLGNDLSPEEMKIANLATDIISKMVIFIKELIRSIMGLLKQENTAGHAISVDSLEKLLKLCQGIGLQVDELGACLYPPQEISSIRTALNKISGNVDEIEAELGSLKSSSEDFLKSCTLLRSALRKLESILGSLTSDGLVEEMENLVVSN